MVRIQIDRNRMRTHVTRPDVGPIEKFDNKQRYVQSKNREFPLKPLGFWYQVDGDWERWCESEQPDWIGSHRYTVDLGQSKMLVLESAQEIRDFGDEYGYDPFKSLGLSRHKFIEWERVAEKYDGLEIPDYVWACRLDFTCFWYYGWDCASGVVWNVLDVKVEPVEPLLRKRRRKIEV